MVRKNAEACAETVARVETGMGRPGGNAGCPVDLRTGDARLHGKHQGQEDLGDDLSVQRPHVEDVVPDLDLSVHGLGAEAREGAPRGAPVGDEDDDVVSRDGREGVLEGLASLCRGAGGEERAEGRDGAAGAGGGTGSNSAGRGAARSPGPSAATCAAASRGGRRRRREAAGGGAAWEGAIRRRCAGGRDRRWRAPDGRRRPRGRRSGHGARAPPPFPPRAVLPGREAGPRLRGGPTRRHCAGS